MNLTNRFLKYGAIVLAVILIGIAIYYYVRPIPSNNTSADAALRKQIEKLSKAVKVNEKRADSLKLLKENLEAENKLISSKYALAKNQYKIIARDYRLLKENERAQVFMQYTQTTPVGNTIFYKDSLLVPMSNIDFANIRFMECDLCDTISKIKTLEISNLTEQIKIGNQELSVKDDIILDLNAQVELVGVTNEVLTERLEATEKKVRWKTIKGTIKDFAIVGLLVLVIVGP